MKRSEILKRLAIFLCQLNGGEWQAHPNNRDLKRQSMFENHAAHLLVFVETKMLDFKWNPEE